MPQPLVPAAVAFAPDGVPYSERYGDRYHSAAGGPAQARHVFLGGSGLPERWRGRRRFAILETGFGLGLNFLATWQAWKRDPGRCERLHFVSVEKHPFRAADLAELHARYPELADESAELRGAWPMLVPGVHRLDFGGVVLTLLFGDAACTRELRLAADALYLDGFAPDRNPELWSPGLLRALSRLCAPGTTVATWSVAGAVRESLERTGFAVEKRPGFGGKREMLTGRLLRAQPDFQERKNRTATVIGAGLAGAAICERLCARGWEVTLCERRQAPALEASGNPAGVFHPVMTPDDSVFARLTRAGFLHALASWRRFGALRWDRCGVLQLARGEKEADSQRAALAALAPPAEYARHASREEASARAGVAVAAEGLWFPEAGWVDPRSLVRAQLQACGARLKTRFSNEILRVEELGENPVILATADDRLCPVAHARLRRVRGQVSFVPEAALQAPKAVVLRGGFVLPPIDGACAVGASFDLEDDDPEVRESSHEGNLERLAGILPGARVEAPLGGRVGFRVVAPDRLPLAGRLRDNVYALLAYGSRGLLWSSLAAELVASSLEGEPLPLEGRLIDALDPLRFERRAARRRAP